jgi:hypothetical protein
MKNVEDEDKLEDDRQWEDEITVGVQPEVMCKISQ